MTPIADKTVGIVEKEYPSLDALMAELGIGAGDEVWEIIDE